jgi:hypothetical protein
MRSSKLRLTRVVLFSAGILLLQSPGLLPGIRGANWTAGPNLPTSLIRGVGVYFPANGNVYIMGGRSSDAAGSGRTTPLEFNPLGNTWTSKLAAYPDNQINNMACGLLTVSGVTSIYCVGGSAAAGTTATARVFRYNPATDSISTTGMDAWPETLANTLPGGFAVYSNKLFILGGFNLSTGAMTNRIWQFDPTAAAGSQWRLQGATLPVAMGFIPTAVASLWVAPLRTRLIRMPITLGLTKFSRSPASRGRPVKRRR